ncbi:hypothetical protein KGY79_10355 [Candidatus Bipolaricaulota bacterium]|nr:hypothetical protein [Candidatus Bipolaricaulota bacterium]
MAKSEEVSDKQMWIRRGKLTFYGIIAAGIGFLVGLYIVAPMMPKTAAYVPDAVKKMETDVVGFTNPENGEVLLPVKITEESDAVDKGLNNIGSEAWGNTYLLFDQGDVTGYGEDFDTSKIESSLSFAAMNGEGEVVKIKEAVAGDEEVEIESDHRWVLIMKTGVMNEFGVKVGSKLMIDTLPGS